MRLLFLSTVLGRIGIWNVASCGGGGGRGGGEENWRTWRKTLGARMRTNNKHNPHLTMGHGIEPDHSGGRQVLSLLHNPL